jgi:hypothetical protein
VTLNDDRLCGAPAREISDRGAAPPPQITMRLRELMVRFCDARRPGQSIAR